jgi:predicted transcriptional regulator
MILYRHDLSAAARLTYVVLKYEHALKPLEPLVLTQTELAERVGKSWSSVRNYLEELREAGYIAGRIHQTRIQFTFTTPFNPENDALWDELWNGSWE